MNKPHIALFGYYNSDNWGDNLMALIFASYLNKIDVPYSAYLKNTKKGYYASQIKNTSNTIDELVSGKDIVIYGGGGILVPGQYLPVEFSEDLQQLIDMCRSKNIPIYALSIGGIGNPNIKLTPPFRDHFLQNIDYATVRNSSDLPLLDRYGKEGQFYHDILWLAPECFKLRKKSTGRLTIGINCQTTYCTLIARIYWKLFRLCLLWSVKSNPDIDFIFIDSKIATDTKKKFAPMRAFPKYPNTREYKFCEADKDLEIIQKLDILFSDKLHLGLACLSLDIPFVSVRGQLKTKRMLENIDLSRLYYGPIRAFKLLWQLPLKKFLCGLIDGFKVPQKEKIKRSAQGHFTELSRIVDRLN